MPINVHAMAKDIPLVYLYNYAYTFDRLAVEVLYGANNLLGDAIIASLCVKDSNTNLFTADDMSSRDKFTKLLINPYTAAKITDNDIVEIFQGDMDSPLGRPKFLSDELFNKSLFGNLYGNTIPNNMLRYNRPQFKRNGPKFELKSTNGRKLVNVPFDTATPPAPKRDALAVINPTIDTIAEARFSTVFVRNLMFLVNAYRCLRFRLMNDLMYNRGVVVNKNAITRPDNTEFYGNEQKSDRPKVGRKHGFEDVKKFEY